MSTSSPPSPSFPLKPNLGLGLLNAFAFLLPTTKQGVRTMIIGSTLLALGSQLGVIYQQYRYMKFPEYNLPPTDPSSITTTLANIDSTTTVNKIKSFLLRRATSICAVSILDIGMLLGGGYEKVWKVSREVGNTLSGGASNVLSTMIFTSLILSLNHGTRTLADHISSLLFNLVNPPPPPGSTPTKSLNPAEPGAPANRKDKTNISPAVSTRIKNGIFRAGIVGGIGILGAGLLEYAYERMGMERFLGGEMVGVIVVGCSICLLGLPYVVGRAFRLFLRSKSFVQSQSDHLARPTSASGSVPSSGGPPSRLTRGVDSSSLIPFSEWRRTKGGEKALSALEEAKDPRLAEGFEERVHEIAKKAGGTRNLSDSEKYKEYEIWVEMRSVEESEGNDYEKASLREATRVGQGPEIKDGKYIVLKESQLLSLSVEVNLALIANGLLLSRSPPKISTTLLPRINIQVIALSLLYLLTLTQRTILSSSIVLPTIYPSLITDMDNPQTLPFIFSLLVTNTILDPIMVWAYTLQRRQGRNLIEYPEDAKRFELGEDIRRGWVDWIGMRQGREQEEDGDVMDVGTSASW